ncbi:heterokaryon incompatibility protein-domain-containing protein [Paraphoma chrysanthemicola]|nr:heterokaryon incompatibility protein-domain-containing protein [Paraphoma chrysanthemicola]
MDEDSVSRSNDPNQEDLFKHRPLDLDPSTHSIRLIRIHATEDDNKPINCDIKAATINDEYICLSYVWGEPSRAHWVLVDGKQLYIRQNLRDFLATARKMEEFRDTWIWIDAICIDQGNLRERGHQVQQMGRIFSNATRVVAWLGDDLAISWFFAWVKDPQLISPLTPHSFITSPYWRRAWITQEVALAREVVYMARTTTLRADSLQPRFMRGTWRDGTRLMDEIRYLRDHCEKKSLVQLLQMFNYKECDEVRDRVFSMLALCWDGFEVEVNYSRSDTQCAWGIMASCRHNSCLCSLHIIATALNLPVSRGPWLFTGGSVGKEGCADLRLPIIWDLGIEYPIVVDRILNHSYGLDSSGTVTIPLAIKKHFDFADEFQLQLRSRKQVVCWKQTSKHSQQMEMWAIMYIDLTAVCQVYKRGFILLVNLSSGRAYTHSPHCKPLSCQFHPFFAWEFVPVEQEFLVDLPTGTQQCKIRMSITQWHQIAVRGLPKELECCPRVNGVRGPSETELHGSQNGFRLQFCTGIPGIYGC